MLPPDDSEFGTRLLDGAPHIEKRISKDEQRADQELFLAAIEKMRPPGRLRGFALSTLCRAWPKAARGKMAQKQKSRTSELSDAPGLSASSGLSGSFQSSGAAAAEKRADSDEFLDAMRQVTPLAGGGRGVAKKMQPRADAPAAAGTAFADSIEKSMEFALYASDEYIEGHVAGLDELTLNRLKAGHFSPEAHLDLHGLNAEQAWESLREFMRKAWYKGLRCVLLVPGRGRNSPQGRGILRARLSQWLTQEPFRRVVLAFCTARPHDGGAGGVYALLRRSRKKGHIQWERLPEDADLHQS